MSAFDKVIGYESIKNELIRFCDVLKNPDRYRKLGVTIPAGILLEGEPGIGKTLMVNCFIEESGCKSFTIRKGKPNGDFVNEICETFRRAKEEARAIVFLDDMDKYANEDEDHRDAEEYVAVQSCIDECKGSGVFVLATVNTRYCLPDSLIRVGRFDRVIEMLRPNGKDARKIVEYYLGQKQVIGDIDMDMISRLMEGYTCATLETMVNEAGIYAGFDQRNKIEQNDLFKAYVRMILKVPESEEEDDSIFTRSIAVHEAGHVVVGEVLDPGFLNAVALSTSSDYPRGITVVRTPPDYRDSLKRQRNEVIRKLGGRAATEAVFGTIDTGCYNDYNEAYHMVSRFVDDYCAYGFDSFKRHDSSEYLCQNKDRLMAQEMEKLYQEAKRIIAEHRELLDRITDELVEKKTLTYKDIEVIWEKCSG